MIATLVRRDGEIVHELLQRLDEAIGDALRQGAVASEINGGQFRLARPHTRKKR